MAEHPEIVDRCAAEVVARMQEIIPDLGEEIAADSTPVASYSNSDRTPPDRPGRLLGLVPQGWNKGRRGMGVGIQSPREPCQLFLPACCLTRR